MRRRIQSRFVKGFTLLELSISLVIFAIMTTVILFNYPDSVVRINLANLTHKLALLLRESQIRGSSVDSQNGAVSGYGIYVDLTKSSQVITFNDLADYLSPKVNGIYVGDGLYSTGGITDETKSTVSFPARYVITKLCVGTGFPFTCNTDNTPAITSLTVTFKRPSPRANIYINNSIQSTIGGACFELHSPRYPLVGHVRSVRVFYSGMITTSNQGCS